MTNQVIQMKTIGYKFWRSVGRFSALHQGLETPGNGGFMDEGAEETPAAKRLREQR